MVSRVDELGWLCGLQSMGEFRVVWCCCCWGCCVMGDVEALYRVKRQGLSPEKHVVSTPVCTHVASTNLTLLDISLHSHGRYGQ
jgi:hypothetical protein